MPQRLSSVGGRHAEARASPGVTDAGTGLTPAQALLAGQHDPGLPAEGRFTHVGKPPIASPGAPAQASEPDLDEPVQLSPMPPPLPEPASEIEADQHRFILRGAIFELDQDLGRLAALEQARERAREEWRAAQTAVTEAEAVLAEVRKHSRAHLIAAYIDNRPTEGMTEAQAKLELAARCDELRHAQEIEQALIAEIAQTEACLPQRRQDVAAATGKLLSRTCVIGLVQQVYDAFASIRRCRLAIVETQRIAHLDDDLCRLAMSAWPSEGARYGGGYVTDEKFVGTFTAGATALLADAEAPLPDPIGSNSSGTGSSDPGTGSSSTKKAPSPVPGAPHRGSAPRQRAQGAATPSLARPARRKRAGGKAAGMPVRRRASLARERDPLTGKWLAKQKAADQGPPPE